MKETLIIQQRLALGDAIILSALARDIQRQYPGRFTIVMDTHFREIWSNNPYARAFDDNAVKGRRIHLSYIRGIKAAERGQKIHVLAWPHQMFQVQTGLVVPVTEPKGHLVLTPAELVPLVSGHYWLLVAGGKLDVTVKLWRHSYWQELAERMAAAGIQCVQAGSTARNNVHIPLNGVINMVGKTPNARLFMNLVANADGIICPVTAAMHLAACFDKPCVVIAGGREAPWWERYSGSETFGEHCTPVRVPHRFLHTLGKLECCQTKGCWRHRTQPLGNNDQYDRPDRICKLPVLADGVYAPRCMDLITVNEVMDAVMSYRNGETVIPAIEIAEKPAIPAIEIAEPPPPSLYTRRVPLPSMLDHPLIGGRLTAFVLCYGDYPGLARTCIESILTTTPPGCLDLRVAAAAVSPETTAYLKTKPITKIYDAPDNPGKYVLMRRMFRDPELPIKTSYLVWFDDDTKCVTANWLEQLCAKIITHHAGGVRLFGWHMLHDLQNYRRDGHDPLRWFREASWWRGKPLRVRGTHQEAPNGTVIDFVPGWFWAMATEMIAKADIPDSRLIHNGDMTIGEAVHQAGFKLQDFNADKTYIWTPSREQGGRRGSKVQPFPWAPDS